jgi:Fur family ferric uptake transcriptional regulator
MERSTRQKTAIRSTIDSAKRPLTPLEVLDGARLEVPALSIATVYRNLKSLLQDGVIKVVPLPGDSPRYESTHAANTHHHHFQCSQCQRVFDVHGCPGDLERLAPPGFSVDRHELTLYGRCADCDVRAVKSRSRNRRPTAQASPVPHLHRHAKTV